MANNNGCRGIHCATIVHYRECQRNNAADGCNCFLNAGVEEPHPPVTFYCAARGCHQSLHHVKEVPVQLDPAVVRVLHWMLSTSAVVAAHRRQAPLLPLMAANEENLGDGDVEQEPPEKKRRRARFSDVQIVEMMKYAAVELGWSLEGYDEDDLGEFCEAIEITPQSFKVWMKNNKNEYLETKESSSHDDNGRSIV